MHDEIRQLLEQLQNELDGFEVEEGEDLDDLEISVRMLKERIHPVTSERIVVLIDGEQPGLGDAVLLYVDQSERLLGPEFARFESLSALRSRGEDLKAEPNVAFMSAFEPHDEPEKEPPERGDPVAASFALFGAPFDDRASPDDLLRQLGNLVAEADVSAWQPGDAAMLTAARAALFERRDPAAGT